MVKKKLTDRLASVTVETKTEVAVIDEIKAAITTDITTLTDKLSKEYKRDIKIHLNISIN